MPKIVFNTSLIKKVEKKFPVKEKIIGNLYKGPYGDKRRYQKTQFILKISTIATNFLGRPYYFIKHEELIYSADKFTPSLIEKNKDAIWVRLNDTFYFKDIATRNLFFESIKPFRYRVDNPETI